MKLHLPVSLFRLLLGTLLIVVPHTALSAGTGVNGKYNSSSSLAVSSDASRSLTDYLTITISDASGYGIDVGSNASMHLYDNGTISVSGTNGMGIRNQGVLLIEDGGNNWYSGNISIVGSANYGIYNNSNPAGVGNKTAKLTMRGNDDIIISDAHGAGVCNVSSYGGNSIVNLENNGVVSIKDISGNGIYNCPASSSTATSVSTISIKGNKGVEIMGNKDSEKSSSYSSNNNGNGIYNTGQIIIENNGYVDISANASLKTNGGNGIYNTGEMYITLNGDIFVSDNKFESSNRNTSSGHGIYNTGILEITYNSDIVIQNNKSNENNGTTRATTDGIWSSNSFSISHNNNIIVSDNGTHGMYSVIERTDGTNYIEINDNKNVSICGNGSNGIYLVNYNYGEISHLLTINHNENIYISNNASTGISGYNSYGTTKVEINGNKDIEISGNGGNGITGGSVEMNANAMISIIGNSGVGISVSSLKMENNGDIFISDNFSSENGYDGLYIKESGTIKNNGNLFISGNSNNGIKGNVEICENQSLTVTGNGASGIGASSLIILNDGCINISDNGGIGIGANVNIRGNESISLENNGGTALDLSGGVIEDNKDIVISNNGGMGIDSYSELTIQRNTSLFITDNKDTGILGTTVSILNDGDITVERNGGYGIRATLTMKDNGNISISHNASTGLAGYGYSFLLSGNEDITVSENKAYGIVANASSSNQNSFITNNGNISILNNSKDGIYVNSGTYGSASLTIKNNCNIYLKGNNYGIFASGGVNNKKVAKLTISGNADIEISSNKGCGIYNQVMGEISISGNGNISILDNQNNSKYQSGGGISNRYRVSGASGYVVTTLIENNGDVAICGNEVGGTGGGICNEGVMSISDNRHVIINSNHATSGGGIHNDNDSPQINELKINRNVSLDISGNTASAEGGGIKNTGNLVEMAGNGEIVINGNTASSSGGGIYNGSETTMTLSGNGNIAISGNAVLSGAGGGIYNSGDLELLGNGDITFRGNTASQTNAYFGGGAIANYGSMALSGNGDITISGNATFSTRVNSSNRYGVGAAGIYNTGSLVLEGNRNITISDNTAATDSGTAYGGGVYNNGAMAIIGNQSVTFRGNLQQSATDAVLNGVYSTIKDSSKVVTLAAPEAGRMDFYDPFLVKMDSATTDTLLHLNGVQDESGNYVATGGTIRLTGESTEADLAAAYQRAGVEWEVTQEAIAASRTSSTNGHTALHDGELQIVQQAILETNGLTAEGAGNATLRLEDGTLRSTAAVTIEGGSTLALSGVNTLTATTLDLRDGATLDFTVGSANTEGAVLTLDTALTTGSLTLNLAGVAEAGAGVYKLITLADASQYNTDSWTSDFVSVIGGSFSQLSWQGNTLVYNANCFVVENGAWEDIPAQGAQNPLPIIIRDGVASFQQEETADLVLIYDNSTTNAWRMASIECSTHFARIDLGSPEWTANWLYVLDGQIASTASLNGEGVLTKVGGGVLEITGAGDHSGTMAVLEGAVVLTGEGQLSSDTLMLGVDAMTFSLRRAAARSADAPLITTESGITLAQNDSSRTGSLSGHDPLSAQGTAIIGQAGQRAVADNVCIALDNAQATFTLGNLDLNNTVVDATAAAGLILHDVRLDATSQVSNRADVLAQMTGQNSVQLGSLVSITGNGQLSTEQLYGVELASTGSLTLGMDSGLLAAAGLTEGGVAELWLAGLQVADTATLSFEDVLQADGLKLAITIQAIERATDGTRLQIAVAAVPEPATATLTLLALSALAARRRRGLRPDSSLRPAC